MATGIGLAHAGLLCADPAPTMTDAAQPGHCPDTDEDNEEDVQTGNASQDELCQESM